jgi:hypothetical protein
MTVAMSAAVAVTCLPRESLAGSVGAGFAAMLGTPVDFRRKNGASGNTAANR